MNEDEDEDEVEDERMLGRYVSVTMCSCPGKLISARGVA